MIARQIIMTLLSTKRGLFPRMFLTMAFSCISAGEIEAGGVGRAGFVQEVENSQCRFLRRAFFQSFGRNNCQLWSIFTCAARIVSGPFPGPGGAISDGETQFLQHNSRLAAQLTGDRELAGPRACGAWPAGPSTPGGWPDPPHRPNPPPRTHPGTSAPPPGRDGRHGDGD